MRCQARFREDRRSPWVDCTRDAKVVLAHRRVMKAYCAEDALRFVEVFPRGTFKQVTIGGSRCE